MRFRTKCSWVLVWSSFLSGACASEPPQNTSEPSRENEPTAPPGARAPVAPLPTEPSGGGAPPTDNPWLHSPSASGGGGASEEPASGPGGASTPGAAGQATGGGGSSAGPNAPPPAPPQLLITRYLEGKASDKALEITLVGDEGAEIGACEVWTYVNGGVSPYRRVALSGALAPGQSLVVCGPKASPPLAATCDLVSTGIVHNGNDALVLRCGDQVMDSLGRVGEDPGKGWGAELSTQDVHLVRSCDVLVGDTTFDDAFVPEPDWYATALDDLTRWNQRSCPALGAGGAPG